MSNLKLQWMYQELQDAGVNVRAAEDWSSRTMPTANTYEPVAVLNHHTAGASLLVNYPLSPYWPDHRLWDRCNITIQPNGVVVVLNAGYAYDSGKGDPTVLLRVKADHPIQSPQDFTDDDRINGNPYFIDIEVQHVGDGSPINPPQREALIETNAVLLAHYDWDSMTRLLGHKEWTRRKVDPKWGGQGNPMPDIRSDTEGRMTMVTRNDKADEGLGSLKNNFEELKAAGVFSSATQPGGITFNDEFATFLLRFEDHIVGKYNLGQDITIPLNVLQRGDTVELR